MQETPTILSIQSHVVHGYVGNRSAVFPLQVLGFEVDYINSVQLCNHTGYKKVAGQILDEKDLSELIDGIKANGLDNFAYLLTGYVGSPSFLTAITGVLQHLKRVNPNIIYVCDPVMGDNGELYVPKELIEIYRDNVVPVADILTPNQYEVEVLTGIKIKGINDAWKAIDKIHSMGCKTVVVTSSELGNDKYLLAMASSRLGGSNHKVTIQIPKLSAVFVGSGDVFAALLLAWMHKTGNDIKTSIEKTVATLQAILKKTVEAAKGLAHNNPKNLELKLIQSKRDIEEPQVTIFAKIEKI